MSQNCKRCNKVVYAVEQVRVTTGSYHKHCFKCSQCNHSLALGSQAVHDNNIYCKNCYNKHFGPQGFGYGNLSSYQNKPINGLCDNCGAVVTGKFCCKCGHKL